MKIHSLHEPPGPEMGEALERFEARFRYPLGEGMHFRISHGHEYLPFFQAMGEATVWVAERDGEVLGTLAAILRSLHLADGEMRRAAYLCDLKVIPDGRAGRVLAALTRAVTSDLISQGLKSAYAVVMGGTARTPVRYTGRLGIPMFEELGDVAILKVAVPDGAQTGRATRASAPEVGAVHAVLGNARPFARGGKPALRSLMTPVPLLGADGNACGVVEDTRRGKRLWLETGEELRAAHLSSFAYATIDAGAGLVCEALVIAAEEGFPALFVAIPAAEAPAFAESLRGLSVHVAPAKVYGCGLPRSEVWIVNPSEI